MIEQINSPNAPQPKGHYARAVRCGEVVYVSGILPFALDDKEAVLRPFNDQVEIVLRNADEILKTAGCSLRDVAKASVYVVDIANWSEFDRLYGAFFGNHRPARTVVPVPDLHHGFAVEIDLIAHASA